MITVERIEPFGVLDLLAAQRNFDRVGREALDAGGVSASMRFGVATLTFTASAASATTTVDHGLGRQPVVVVCTSTGGPGFGHIPSFNVVPGATSFDVVGDINSAFTGTVDFSWIVIG